MERQLAIYMAGVGGERPAHPVGYEALRERARQVLTAEAWAYVAGGAGLEDTMRENREAFRRWRIVPRHLRGVGARDLRVELLGRALPAPVLLAPVGVQGILHPEGELAPARAAAALGLPVVLSTVSSRPLEAVAEAAGDGPRWFQLYWPRDPELAASFVSRAGAAGYSAIVVTLDLPLLAWRPRDIENAYLPFLVGEGLANYLTDPVFLRGLAASPADDPRPAIEKFGRVFAHPDLTWDELPRLREMTRLPIVLKGILDPDDARRALDAGAKAVIVSNHGGRQVDGAIASLDALPAVLEVIAGRVPVLLDSGVRGGADAFKALALGARAVLIGRPYAWALAVGGEPAVRDLLQNTLAELDLTMGLSGCRSIAEIGPHTLRPRDAAAGGSSRSPST
jgi:isopentenyl diphosphate isomerase/L-lactate dehydrogenase-like FMN-dependent dehydrogenase